MISNGALTSNAYIWGAGSTLVFGLAVVLMVWGRRDRIHSRASARTLARELAPVLVCFFFVVLSSIFLALAYNQRLTEANTPSNSILGGMLASLIEDICFFFTIGLVVFVVQRRAHERGRQIDDRVDLLFDARQLTSGELDDLKKRVLNIGCDYRLNDCVVDIRAYDTERECLLLDVARRWEVESYIRSETVACDWKLKVEPDPIEGKLPLFEIFPITTREFRERKRRWRRGTVREPISETECLYTGTVMDRAALFEWSPIGLRVRPGTIREIQSRYRGWQRLKLAGSGASDSWNFKAEKHWDRCMLRIRNSLQAPVRVSISGAIKRDCEIQPGAEESDYLIISDMPRGSQISIQFEPKSIGANETRALFGASEGGQHELHH